MSVCPQGIENRLRKIFFLCDQLSADWTLSLEREVLQGFGVTVAEGRVSAEQPPIALRPARKRKLLDAVRSDHSEPGLQLRHRAPKRRVQAKLQDDRQAVTGPNET